MREGVGGNRGHMEERRGGSGRGRWRDGSRREKGEESTAGEEV